MSTGGCNCCSQPTCNSPTFVCDSVTKSVNKCGWTKSEDFFDPDSQPSPKKFFLRYIYRYYGAAHRYFQITPVYYTSCVSSGDYTSTREIDPSDCSINCVGCTGSWTGTNDDNLVPHQEGYGTATCTYTTCDGGTSRFCAYNYSGPDGGECECHVEGGTCDVDTYVNQGGEGAEAYYEFKRDVSCSFTNPEGDDLARNVHEINRLENPYTTELLIETAEENLPEYAGFGEPHGTGQGTTCSAFRNLSVDESSFTIRRFKWKLRHFPTGSCYLKVWVRTRFRPEGTSGASDVLTDLTPYEWIGAPTDGGLCFTDSTKPFNHADNAIESDVSAEVMEPETDGTVTVEVKKWSCLEGYEPDDPLDNGNRPSPDNNPNGWPK